jgi:hypothetical protein
MLVNVIDIKTFTDSKNPAKALFRMLLCHSVTLFINYLKFPKSLLAFEQFQSYGRLPQKAEED